MRVVSTVGHKREYFIIALRRPLPTVMSNPLKVVFSPLPPLLHPESRAGGRGFICDRCDYVVAIDCALYDEALLGSFAAPCIIIPLSITSPLAVSIALLFGVRGGGQAKTIKTYSCLKLVFRAVIPTLPETEVSESRSGVGGADDRATFADVALSDGKTIRKTTEAGVVTRETPSFREKTGRMPHKLRRSALVSHTADTGSLSGWHLTRRHHPSVPKTKLAMESVEGLRY